MALSSKKTGPWRRHRSRALWGVAGAGALAGLAFAARPVPLVVDTATARREPLRVLVEEDGKTRVRSRYIVSAPLSGRVSRITLRPGDEVPASSVLTRMVPASSPLLDERAQAEALARVSAVEAARKQSEVAVERSKVAFDLARAEAERIKTLTTSGAMTPSLLDKAEGEVKIRASEVEAARLGAQIAVHELAVARSAATRVKPGKHREESFEVTSPVEGRVLRVFQESEGIVAAGTPLLEVGDTRHLEVVVDVLTTDAVLLRPGMKASIERWSAGAAMGEAQEGQALSAHVRSIEPAAFTRVSALGVEEQRVNVVLDIDAPQERWSALGDGFRVDTSITVREIPAAVQVPLGAIFRKGGAWTTFVISGGKASLRSVEVGARSGATVEIKSGLAEGEQVIVHPSDRVIHGSTVKTREDTAAR